MNSVRLLVVALLAITGINVVRIENSSFIPVSIQARNETEKKLAVIGIKDNDELVQTIDFAAKKYKVSQEFIIALTSTESNFDQNAISSKGYKGLMQIPQKVPVDANILIGVRIFIEKMRLSHGDVLKAICLYKGYGIGSREGIAQAKKVMKLKEAIMETI
jgi:hypothetical protein